MKKLIPLIAGLCALLALSACGGSKATNATVSLGKLDDYFTVESYKLETDIADKDLLHLDDVKGTLTLVLKRNKEEMKFKPSQVESASITGSVSSTSYYVFRGDCTANAKMLIKMEPGKKETVVFNVHGIDPGRSYKSDEENAHDRQIHYDALSKKGGLEEITLDIDWEEDLNESLQTLKALKEIVDDDD